MRSLFVTVTLAALLGSASVGAQQTATEAEGTTPNDAMAAPPSISAPEGFTKADVVLTTDNLEGAEVYDAAGEEIGEVHGLVFANGRTSMLAHESGSDSASVPAVRTTETETDGPTTGANTDNTSIASPADGDVASGNSTTTEPPTDSEAETSQVDAEAPAAADATNTIETNTASPEATAPAMDSDSSNIATGTDTGDNERVEAVPSASDLDGRSDKTAGTDFAAGGISHAIIDIGGFLGMGEHRVAVPVEDLVTYSRDTELRIYLPWTREQMEALPEFDEDGP